MAAPPATTAGFSVAKLIKPSTTPLPSESPAVEVPADCCNASSYFKALASPGLRTEDKSTRAPCLLDKHCCVAGGLVLKPEEFKNLGGEIEGNDGNFLGSCFLSQRTDIGVKPAALRASMAYSTSETVYGALKELLVKLETPLKQQVNADYVVSQNRVDRMEGAVERGEQRVLTLPSFSRCNIQSVLEWRKLLTWERR